MSETISIRVTPEQARTILDALQERSEDIAAASAGTPVSEQEAMQWYASAYDDVAVTVRNALRDS